MKPNPNSRRCGPGERREQVAPSRSSVQRGKQAFERRVVAPPSGLTPWRATRAEAVPAESQPDLSPDKLDIEMNERKHLEKSRAGVARPVVDFNRCEGKADCVAVCPYDVFLVRKIDRSEYQTLSFLGKFRSRVHGGLVAYTPNADQCHACGLCLKACPERAIKLSNISAS